MKAGAAGGIEAVVKAVNTHIENPNVCENGCQALSNMIENNGKTLIKNKQNKMNR